MKYLSVFYSKHILKTPFFLLAYGIIALIFMAFNLALDYGDIEHTNYIVRFDSLAYIEIVLVAIVFCIAAYFAQEKNGLEQMCLYSKAQIEINKIVMTIVCSLSFCFIPALFIILSAAIERTELKFTVLSLVYAIIRWAIIIIITETTAYALASIMKSRSVYFFCIPCTVIFSYLNIYIFLRLFGKNAEKISNFFSLQKTFINGLDMDYPGPRIDLFLISKVLCACVFLFLIMSIMWFFLSNKHRRIAGLALIGCFVGEVISVAYWNALYPEYYSYDKKLYIADYEKQNWQVLSYEGNINLSENTSIQCEIVIHPTAGNLDTITFRLDEQFKNVNISIGNTSCSYTRNGDYITIRIPSSDMESVIALRCSYSGRISYVSDISSVNIYTSWFSAALPVNFAFLPILDGDYSKKDYSLTVIGLNDIISNLNTTSAAPHSYNLKGKAQACCIFMGFFDREIKDGIELYHARYNNLSDYWNELEIARERKCLNPNTYKVYDRTDELPEKVFVIYYLYGVLGVPVVFDDCVFLNYGYPSSR